MTEVKLKAQLDNTDFKKTLKLTWLADVPSVNIPAVAVHYDNIVSKAVLGLFNFSDLCGKLKGPLNYFR